MFKAPRCQCGCNLPTAGGKYLPGHNSKVGVHWATGEKRLDTILKMAEARRQRVEMLLREGRSERDFSEGYLNLIRVVRLIRPDAQPEVVVVTPERVRIIDCGVEALKLGWEWDGGNRYHLGTAKESQRDRALQEQGWTLIHCKAVPEEVEIRIQVFRRENPQG